MSNILAAIGVEQLKKLERMNLMRREVADRLTAELAEISEITPPVERAENKHVYQMYTIRLADGLDRDAFVRDLNARGIGASIHFFPPVHHMAPYRDGKFRQDALPVTEKVIQEIVTLPMYPQMTEEELAFMIESIKSSLSELA